MSKVEHKIAIRFNEVYFSYGNVEVLNKVSFHIHEGEFVTIVGPNGSGKTTILKLILGLLTPLRGSIEVLGKNPTLSLTSIGYVPQSVDIDKNFPITAEEVIKMGMLTGFANKKIAGNLENILDILDIKDLKKKQYSELSGGQKRKVLVARALISNPAMLILDEPNANMDMESEKRLLKVLGKLKRETTILIVTHDTDFVTDLTDVVLCIGKSKEKEHCIVRHAVEPVGKLPPDLYEGKVLRVLHDTDLPDDSTCCRS